jgi:FSR family fosmidomycin resistance protein-like MFS transporter
MTVTATTTAINGTQARVLALVSSGHFMSHFYGMVLPPLYPFLHDYMNVGYTELGFLLSLQNIIGSGMQFPAGMVVDRFGAKNMLLYGILSCALSFAVIGLIGTYQALLVMTVVYAIGNAVFHPADYSILNGTMNEAYMGRSFSIHTFIGELGTAIAPSIMLFVAMTWGWRFSLMFAATLGVLVFIGFLLQWQMVKDDVVAAKPKKARKGAVADGAAPMTNGQLIRHIMKSPAIVFLFLFFCVGQLASGGLKTFSVSGLVAVHDTPVTTAGTALSVFLFTMAFGVLLGGYAADKTKRHDLYAAFGLLTAATVVLLVGTIDFSLFGLIAVFSIAGLANGVVRPARDMMIRNAAPKGTTGKVFGFVFSGQSLGSGIAPPIFGYLIDSGKPAWIFYVSAVFLCVCASMMLMSGRSARLKADEERLMRAKAAE